MDIPLKVLVDGDETGFRVCGLEHFVAAEGKTFDVAVNRFLERVEVYVRAGALTDLPRARPDLWGLYDRIKRDTNPFPYSLRRFDGEPVSVVIRIKNAVCKCCGEPLPPDELDGNGPAASH